MVRGECPYTTEGIGVARLTLRFFRKEMKIKKGGDCKWNKVDLDHG